MDRSEALFSNLTSEQIEDLKALESKFNTSNTKQETILIAYADSK